MKALNTTSQFRSGRVQRIYKTLDEKLEISHKALASPFFWSFTSSVFKIYVAYIKIVPGFALLFHVMKKKDIIDKKVWSVKKLAS